MKKTLIISSLFLLPTIALAAYTGNVNGTVTWVKIYNSDNIYFGFSNMPTDHGCTDNFFAINPSLDPELKKRYYSMLLTAKSTKSNVEVGYDKKSASCTNGRPMVESMSLTQ